MKCVACGSANLIEGSTVDEMGSMSEAFKPREVSTLKAAFGWGIRKVNAHACARCGHLQFSVEFTDEDRQKYLKFEGEQPPSWKE